MNQGLTISIQCLIIFKNKCSKPNIKQNVTKKHSSSSVSPTLDPKVHLEDLAAAPLAQELVEQAKVHVVPAVAVGIEGCLLEPTELPQRGHAHDLPGQHLDPVEHRKLYVTMETGWSILMVKFQPRFKPHMPAA